MMNNIKHIIIEELQNFIDEDINKGSFIVWHYTPYDPEGEEFSLENELFKPGGGDFYGRGLYASYTWENLEENNMSKYGEYLVEFKVDNTGKFIIMDYDQSRRIYGEKNADLISQMKRVLGGKFNEIYKLHKNEFDRSNEELRVRPKSAPILKNIYKYLINYVDGFFYSGGHDGRACVIYNLGIIHPQRYSKNHGETWISLPSKNYYNKLKSYDDLEQKLIQLDYNHALHIDKKTLEFYLKKKYGTTNLSDEDVYSLPPLIRLHYFNLKKNNKFLYIQPFNTIGSHKYAIAQLRNNEYAIINAKGDIVNNIITKKIFNDIEDPDVRISILKSKTNLLNYKHHYRNYFISDAGLESGIFVYCDDIDSCNFYKWENNDIIKYDKNSITPEEFGDLYVRGIISDLYSFKGATYVKKNIYYDNKLVDKKDNTPYFILFDKLVPYLISLKYDYDVSRIDETYFKNIFKNSGEESHNNYYLQVPIGYFNSKFNVDIFTICKRFSDDNYNLFYVTDITGETDRQYLKDVNDTEIGQTNNYIKYINKDTVKYLKGNIIDHYLNYTHLKKILSDSIIKNHSNYIFGNDNDLMYVNYYKNNKEYHVFVNYKGDFDVNDFSIGNLHTISKLGDINYTSAYYTSKLKKRITAITSFIEITKNMKQKYIAVINDGKKTYVADIDGNDITNEADPDYIRYIRYKEMGADYFNTIYNTDIFETVQYATNVIEYMYYVIVKIKNNKFMLFHYKDNKFSVKHIDCLEFTEIVKKYFGTVYYQIFKFMAAYLNTKYNNVIDNFTVHDIIILDSMYKYVVSINNDDTKQYIVDCDLNIHKKNINLLDINNE